MPDLTLQHPGGVCEALFGYILAIQMHATCRIAEFLALIDSSGSYRPTPTIVGSLLIETNNKSEKNAPRKPRGS